MTIIADGTENATAHLAPDDAPPALTVRKRDGRTT
jgi:hypothetical protein